MLSKHLRISNPLCYQPCIISIRWLENVTVSLMELLNLNLFIFNIKIICEKVIQAHEMKVYIRKRDFYPR